jgi:hypothetical protein
VTVVKRRSRLLVVSAALFALLVGTLACSSGRDHASMRGMSSDHMSSDDHAIGGSGASGEMPGMGHGSMAAGSGLRASESGYALELDGAAPEAGQPARLAFRIQVDGRATLTQFAPDQTKLMHFYAIRADLSGFQHVHPTIAGDGTWTAELAPLEPGSWRFYASFIPDTGSGKGKAFVLSRSLTVLGAGGINELPPPGPSATVDGYDLTVSGSVQAGRESTLSVQVSKGGRPVTDLEPYLDTYAHLTAFHDVDQAFAHLHPNGSVSGPAGGPTLSFTADLPQSGRWRVFIQFQTAGVLHTAAVTLAVS